MLITEHLVQGVDVWINTPRDPGGVWDERHEGVKKLIGQERIVKVSRVLYPYTYWNK